MNRFFVYTIVAVSTFVLGVAGAAIFLIRHKQNLIPHAPASENAMTEKLTQQTAAAGEANIVRLKSLSPYEIRAFVNSNPQVNIEDVWQRLGIVSKFNGNSHYDASSHFFTKCNGCEAETYEYDLDGDVGQEVILRIADDLQEACRYLIFKYVTAAVNEERWRLLGTIDHDFGRYMMPQHMIVLSGGKSWFVVRVQETSGSGVASYSDRLFTVEKNKVIEIMSYSADGHQAGMSDEPVREFSGRVIDCKIERGTATVKIEYSVKYSGTDENNVEIPLWNKRQQAIYHKRISSKKISLDRQHSDVSEREIKAVYAIDSLSDEDLLKYNYEELVRIATKGRLKQKEFLRGFLRHCKPSGKRETLRRILGR